MATQASQSYEIPPSPFENKEGLPKEHAEKVDFTPDPKKQEQREVDTQKANLTRVLRETLVRQELDEEAFTQIEKLTGIPISPEEQVALQAAPRARRAALFLKVTELQNSDRKTLQSWKEAGTPMDEGQYRRNKALLVRLDPATAFDENGNLKDTARWNNRAGYEVTNALLLTGKDEEMGMDLTWTPREREEFKDALTQVREEYAYVNGISENPQAQKELYEKLTKKQTGELSEAAFIKEAAKIETQYELTPAIAEEKTEKAVAETETQEEAYAEITEAEEQEVLTSLGLEKDGTVEVLGVDHGGNVVIQMGKTGEVHCGYNREVATLNWIKVDINGHEYQTEPRETVNAGSFHKEVSLAKVGGMVDYYQLPFDQPEQDKFIEILLTETGDVSAEFTYDQYTDAMGQQVIAFLEMLTPDRDIGTTQAIFEELKITQDGILKPDRLREVASTWAAKRATYTPEEILKQLQEGGERNEAIV